MKSFIIYYVEWSHVELTAEFSRFSEPSTFTVLQRVKRVFI